MSIEDRRRIFLETYGFFEFKQNRTLGQDKQPCIGDAFKIDAYPERISGAFHHQAEPVFFLQHQRFFRFVVMVYFQFRTGHLDRFEFFEHQPLGNVVFLFGKPLRSVSRSAKPLIQFQPGSVREEASGCR